MIHHVTRATRILLFWSLIAAALVLSAVRVLLAGMADYRLELEQKIRDTTGLPLHIGKLAAGMRGFNPQVLLREISVEQADGGAQPAIQLDEVRIGLNLLDLLLTRDWLSSSWVTLVGAKIDIIRDSEGKLLVKGLQASDEQPLWLLQGGKYEILQSQITWHDQLRGQPPVRFEHLDLLLKNHLFGDSHELHLLSRLPEQYGESIRLSASLSGDLFAGKEIAGQVYLEAINLQAGAVLPGELPQGLNLHGGSGDVRLWSNWRDSKPYQVAGYLQAQQIRISRQQGKVVPIDTLDGNFVWTSNDQHWRLAGYDINLFANRQRWSGSEFYLQLSQGGQLAALVKQLEMPALMHFAPLISSDDSEYAGWLALNPQGHLQSVQLFAEQDFQHYALSGEFRDVGIDAYQKLPKLQRLSGKISANDGYGELQLTSNDAGLDAPEWFRNVLAVRRLHGRLHWWHDDAGWQISTRELALDSPDFQTSSDLNLWLPKVGSPGIDMSLRFGAFNDIAKVRDYLPAGVMGKDAVAWLDDAFVAGRIPQGEVRLQGDLDRFPFKQGGGRFETVFVIADGEIQVNENWPHLRDVYADVQFYGEDLQVAITEGRSEQVGIQQAVVTIADVVNSEHVSVHGKLQAKFMDSLQYLLKTPVGAKIAALPQVLSGEGNADIDLDLKIPYHENLPVDVDVNAHLQNVRLNLLAVGLKIDAINGVMNFTEDRISSNVLSGRALGEPLTARFSSDQQASYLDVDGSSTVEALQKQFPFLENDATHGKFNYHSKLTLPYDKTQDDLLSIRSDLKGVSIDAGDNLTKSADGEVALALDFRLLDDKLLPLEVRYGAQLQAALQIDKAAGKLHSAHVVLGEGQPQRYALPGLKLEIHQPSFNLSQAAGAFKEKSANSSWPPLREIALDSQQIIWQGQALGAMQLQFEHRDQQWQGRINSAMAKGDLRIPDQLGGDNRIDLKMDYLNLSAMDTIKLDGTEEMALNDLPLIDIDSRKLLWRNVDLGQMKLQTERVSNGIHFKQVKLRGAKSKIDFSADWLKQAGGTSTQLNGSLNIDNFGAFLSELGVTDDIKETAANIKFNGGWRGAPQQFAMGRLNGQLGIDLSDGRISSIEPGFGRLLGLIAMEQWVKRLSLDFSDIYRQGLAFDRINGHFKIKDGLAVTNDLMIDAVAAKFSLLGQVNLVDKTIDQRVAVVPKSSGALPIAGTIVGGIASIITQAVTDDYKEGYFFGSQYQLSGNWGNVEVKPLHDQDGLVKKTWRGLTDFGWLDSAGE